jgi:hypothetical protein
MILAYQQADIFDISDRFGYLPASSVGCIHNGMCLSQCSHPTVNHCQWYAGRGPTATARAAQHMTAEPDESSIIVYEPVLLESKHHLSAKGPASPNPGAR